MDHQPRSRHLLREELERDFHVVAPESGRAARRLLEDMIFDLAIIDMRLPDVNVPEWLDDIGDHTAFFALADEGELVSASHILLDALHYGAERVFEKNVPAHYILDSVRAYFESDCFADRQACRKVPMRFVQKHAACV
ncbi:hypothetical protein [Kolteria novifilia]|uniref:hypothetical protein n=1 Tax=Kolteria novifilia TaxID=2527975 RepID=UPI003AF3C048